MCIKESPLERGIHEAGIHCTLLCALAFRPLQPQNERLEQFFQDITHNYSAYANLRYRLVNHHVPPAEQLLLKYDGRFHFRFLAPFSRFLDHIILFLIPAHFPLLPLSILWFVLI